MKKLLVLFLALGLAIPALAEHDDDEHEGRGDHGKHSFNMASANPVWLKECGGCHVAYPPGMLPSSSWKKMMASLDKHFGSDASLTAEEQRQVTDYLLRNGGDGRVSTSGPRITETDWFIRKHDEVRANVWKRASIKSPANCQACHPAADKGDYSEHGPNGVRIPR